VWEAFTDPEHITKWQTGPEGTTMPVCEIDLRPGGSWRRVWRNAHGREFDATGIYREVDPPKRIVEVMRPNGEEHTSTTTFTEEGGRTTVVASMRFSSKTARDQALPYAKIGTEANYASLETYLARVLERGDS
jgi:uncharacterized protein YndB with AHSA1/START domain